jgi:hypothetical protein
MGEILMLDEESEYDKRSQQIRLEIADLLGGSGHWLSSWPTCGQHGVHPGFTDKSTRVTP